MGDANLVRSRDLGEHFERKFFECSFLSFLFLLLVHNASTIFHFRLNSRVITLFSHCYTLQISTFSMYILLDFKDHSFMSQ